MSDDPERHGTFRDVGAASAAYPRHGLRRALFPADPSDRAASTAKAATTRWNAAERDVGSPYAIGSKEGGHDAIHPELGTLADFQHLREAAAAHGLELALDFAIQCSPDHPWLKRASRLVRLAAGRLDQICRESAEEIPGHRQCRFLREWRGARSLGGAGRGRAVLVRTGRADFPRRQSAHQAVSRSGNG